MIRLLVFLGICGLAAGEDWTRFRGPNGSGVSKDKGFPAEVGKSKNLVWRTPVRPGKSSPVLTKRHVFLTSFEGGTLYTQCFDRKTGKMLWEREEKRPRDPIANRLNHPAAITPVTDGENVYVFFKDYGFLSYDPAGKLRWKTPVGFVDNTMGLGTSPILAGDLVVLVADQVEGSYIMALDRRNGETRWKKPREEGEGWGTPLLHGPDVVTASRGQVAAYTPANGKRTLDFSGIATTIVGSPILDGDTLYVFGYGSETPAPFAARLARLDKNKDGKLSQDEYGDDAFLAGIAKYVGNRDMVITEDEWNEKQKNVMGPNCLMALRLEGGKARELWRYDKNFTGVIPSVLLYEGVLYLVRNGGVLTSFEASTGKVIKQGRVEGALGGYSTSPVAAEGKVYLASEEGKVTVLRAGGEWEVLSVSDLDEGCYATPALSEGQIFLRTDAALYCFAKP